MKSFIAFLAQEFRALARDEKGLSMVEYAIAGGLVAAVAVTSFTSLGTNIGTKITSLATTVAG